MTSKNQPAIAQGNTDTDALRGAANPVPKQSGRASGRHIALALLFLQYAVYPVPSSWGMGGGGGMMGGGSTTGFNAVDTGGGVAGVIITKVAGTAFNLDILALKSSNTAIDTGFSGSVAVQLQDASNDGGALDATTGCRSSWTDIGGASATASSFSSGRKAVSFTVANAYKDVVARMDYSYTNMGTTYHLISCSDDNFAIRPSSLTITPTDSDWSTAGTGRSLSNTGSTGGNVHKAGQPFTIQVVARNSSGSTTSNYNGTPTVKTLTCSLPASCVNGTLTLGTWSGSGTLTTSTASYSEAGAFDLALEDQHFADVDAADGSTTAQRYVPATATVAVGRFVPDHFDLVTVLFQAPMFKTFNSSAAGRTFTYIGQGFGYVTAPQAMVIAGNAAGNTTRNYKGTLWKLAAAGVSQTYASGAGAPALDTGAIGTPTVTADAGTGTVGANANGVIAYVRDTAAPRVPFDANISLTLSVSDGSEAGTTGNGTITTGTSATFKGTDPGTGIYPGIAFDSGKEFRYGRAKLSNAMGSELLNLPVPMEIQYWDAAGRFATNTADKFTTLAAANFSLGNYTKGLTAANMGAGHLLLNGGGVFTSGRQNLVLTKPNPRATGSLDVTLNLAGAGLDYLKGNWTGAGYNQNPVARATLGVFSNANESIYMRENH